MQYILSIDLNIPGPFINIPLPEDKNKRDEVLHNFAIQIESLKEINWKRPLPIDEVKLEQYSPDNNISIHWEIDLSEHKSPEQIADKIEIILGIHS